MENLQFLVFHGIPRHVFFSILPQAIFLKPALQTKGYLPYVFFVFWQHSERQQSPGLSASAHWRLLEGCHTSSWSSTLHPGSCESTKGSPATWQDLLLLNLFSQPVTELCAVWISRPNASFNSLLLMEIWGLESKTDFGIDFHQFNSSSVLIGARGTAEDQVCCR